MKAGKLGMEKVAIGRLGNHLFQYNFLSQLANHLSLEKFHPAFLGAELFEGLGKASFFGSHRPTKTIRYSKNDIESLPWETFVDSVHSLTASGKNVVLPPGIMGNRFFDVTYLNPKDMIRLNSESVEITNKFREVKQVRVGIHFRGADYSSWDSNAVMDPSYYLDALDYLSQQVDFNTADLSLITDDPEHRTCREISKRWNCTYGSFRNPSSDFFNLSQCDYIISSPSSFVFWASAFGKEKKMIYSKKWLDYKTGNGDIYWTKLRAGLSPFFQIYQEI